MPDQSPSLRERIVAVLSSQPRSAVKLPIVVPDTLEHDVLRWGYETGTHHMLLHVRDEVAVGWNVMTGTPGARRPRGPLPFASSITAWLASITEAELASVDADRPVAFIERPPLPECAFAGFAVVHPSVARHRVFRDDTLIPSCTFLVFPCHRSEVARDMDAAWATVQIAHVNWSKLERERASAVRAVRYLPPKKGKAAPLKPREPVRPADAKGYVSNLLHHWIELENWDRRVLRFADGAVTVLPAGPTRAVTGRADAEALVAGFLDGNELVAPRPKDALADFKSQLEASCGEDEGAVRPVFLQERATGEVVARLWVEIAGRALSVAYALLDPRLDETRVVELVTGPFLEVFAKGWYRGKIDSLRLTPREGGAVREVPYAPR